MTAASALVSANEPTLEIVETAVRRALRAAATDSAGGVILFLTPEFARHAHAAVLAAARTARCTQVFGGIAAGVCNETAWVLDRPAAAVLVLAGKLALATGGEPGGSAGDAPDTPPMLCCTTTPFPSEWRDSRRYGLHFHGTSGQGEVWQAGRLAAHGIAETRITGATTTIVTSPGLTTTPPRTVTATRGYDLIAVADTPALDSLLAALPPAWRERQPLPLHLINACTTDEAGNLRAAALIAANTDRSLTLSEALHPGQPLAWAFRLPDAATRELEDKIAATGNPPPDFALFLSCIGRGPYFHGGDDRDLAALTGRFPGMPLAGAYGTGQIAFQQRGSRQLQNAVVAALYREESHVQPQP